MIKDEEEDLQKKFDEITNKVRFNDYIFPFGKYKGEFVADVVLEDPNYIDWVLNNIDNEELKEAIQWHLSEK